MNKEILNTIKTTVLSYLPDGEVLLFGSRARGDSNIHSDYDVLVVSNQTFASKEKMNMESKISKPLVYSLNAPFDVLLYNKKDFDLKKHLKGYVIYHALKDAIYL